MGPPRNQKAPPSHRRKLTGAAILVFRLSTARHDAAATSRAIDRLATRPTRRLAELIPRFAAERFLYDYLEDGKLLTRLNHVMRRVGLPLLPASFVELLPAMRQRVRERRVELLTPG
jgi:hypothetical protein